MVLKRPYIPLVVEGVNISLAIICNSFVTKLEPANPSSLYSFIFAMKVLESNLPSLENKSLEAVLILSIKLAPLPKCPLATANKPAEVTFLT